MSDSKLKKGAKLHGQSRELIWNVYKFFKEEAKSDQKIPLSDVDRRAVAATGLSLSMIQKIVNHSPVNKEKNYSQSEPVDTDVGNELIIPDVIGAHTDSMKSLSKLDNFEKCCVRRLVIDMLCKDKMAPTVGRILTKIRVTLGYKGHKTALKSVLKHLGFKCVKTKSGRKLYLEKLDVRSKRMLYLRKLDQYRKAGRPIIYTDEVCMTFKRGYRLIIVHAGSERGFVNNALLASVSNANTGGYYQHMNRNNYEKWVTEHLIPNLSPSSVVVLDNVSYHSRKLNSTPSSSSTRSEMIRWLEENNIPFDGTMLKPELHHLITISKPRSEVYYLDKILEQWGHTVLRLPPNHEDLNAIEYIWGELKSWVRYIDSSLKLPDVQKLAAEKFAQMNGEWQTACNRVKKIEKEYVDYEPFIDTEVDHIIMSEVGPESDDDEDNCYLSDSSNENSADANRSINVYQFPSVVYNDVFFPSSDGYSNNYMEL